MNESFEFDVPSAKDYVKVLKKLKKSINENQRKILERHFRTPNHSVNFATFAEAIGSDDYREAFNEYEALGRMVGDLLHMGYLESASRPGEPLYCSAFGSGNPYRKEDEGYYLVMHREVVEALWKLKWFI